MVVAERRVNTRHLVVFVGLSVHNWNRASLAHARRKKQSEGKLLAGICGSCERRSWSQQERTDVADVTKKRVYGIETVQPLSALDGLTCWAEGLEIPFGELMPFPLLLPHAAD